MAIHATSSVVGAAASYGAEALHTGTTVKLTRTAWIAPIAIATGLCLRSEQKAKFPLFIIGFVVAAILHSLLPQFNNLWQILSAIAKQCLVITLFLVGCGLGRDVLKRIGHRPLLHGVTLWLFVSLLTLKGIIHGFIN